MKYDVVIPYTSLVTCGMRLEIEADTEDELKEKITELEMLTYEGMKICGAKMCPSHKDSMDLLAVHVHDATFKIKSSLIL